MIENKEFQEILSKYPDDAMVTIGVEYNDVKSFWELKVKGIQFRDKGKEMKAIILCNDGLSKEYEHLINGGEVE